MAHEPYFFISYSRKQYFIAKQLAEFLSAHGIFVWLDVERIAPGDDWQTSIDRGLRQCQALIVLASRAAYRSVSVRYEVETAGNAGKPMYLVVIESCPFVTGLAGRVAVIDARSNFRAASTRLAQSLKSGQLSAEQIGKSHLRSLMTLPLGQIKLIQLLLLNACFLLGTIVWMSSIQISLNWPIDPRIEPFLVLALTLVVLWFLSFSYSIFLLVAFRYQWRVSFLELDLWPILCVFLIPMLLFLLTLHLETTTSVSVPVFGDFFNSYFSIQYQSLSLITGLLWVGLVGLFYLYLRYIPHGKLLGVAALICAVSMLPSTSVIVSGILLLVVSVAIAIWQLRETLTGRTIPSAFGASDQRLAGLYTQWSRMDTVWGKHTTMSDADRAWGYWLSPGAFFIDPLSGTRPATSAPSVVATRGNTWRLHYLPADRRCAQRVRQILANQPALSEVKASEASYEIAILSNRTPQHWINALASTHPRLIGIMVSAIDIAGLPSVLHQNQWIDYRQQRPEAIRRLAAVIAGTAEPANPTTPEDFARPLGPFPLKLVSHALRINGFIALVLAGSAVLIQQLSQVALMPAPLIVFSFALGIWSIWSGIRILARNIVFAELCALLTLSVVNIGLWASLGGSALLPRTLSITAGRYNGSLTSGMGFIAAVIALPLMAFLLLGWIELLLHAHSFLAWLPASMFASGRRTLAVSPWRQLDFAYVPYVLSCLILIGMVVGDSPARYAPIHEFD